MEDTGKIKATRDKRDAEDNRSMMTERSVMLNWHLSTCTSSEILFSNLTALGNS